MFEGALQVVWDQTSLAAILHCPRYYRLAIMEGWSRPGMPMRFGAAFAAGVQELLTSGSLVRAVRRVLEASADWDEVWADGWRCANDGGWRNERGNRAVCPNARAGLWQPAPAPDECPLCGGTVETARVYCPVDPYWNRVNLVRGLVAYADHRAGAGMKVWRRPDGQPAVEQSFLLPLGRRTPAGHPYMLAGYIDHIDEWEGRVFVTDNKCTKSSLGQHYGSRFEPSLQLGLYALAVEALTGRRPQALVIEALQVMQQDVRVDTYIVPAHEHYHEDVLFTVELALDLAERCAERGHWPPNLSACRMCAFREVCKLPPEMREKALEAGYEKRLWNPLAPR